MARVTGRQLVVSYLDHSVRYFPIVRGWSVDAASRQITILGEKGEFAQHVPLDNVAHYAVELAPTDEREQSSMLDERKRYPSLWRRAVEECGRVIDNERRPWRLVEPRNHTHAATWEPVSGPLVVEPTIRAQLPITIDQLYRAYGPLRLPRYGRE